MADTTFITIDELKYKFGIDKLEIGQSGQAEDIYKSGTHQGKPRIWAKAHLRNGNSTWLIATGDFLDKINDGAEAFAMCASDKGRDLSDYALGARAMFKPTSIDIKLTL